MRYINPRLLTYLLTPANDVKPYTWLNFGLLG